MLKLLSSGLKLPTRHYAYIFCCMLMTLAHFSGYGQSRKEMARNEIVSENINDAIVSYSRLLKKTSSPLFIAEYAYALALGGLYDAALIQLDRLWFIDNNPPDVNYFSGQVFALMEYDDIAGNLWNSSGKNEPPAWIASNAPILLAKFKMKTSGRKIQNKEDYIAGFRKANEMAAQHYYFQSIALFHELIQCYPKEYLPYVYYSITLEKAGAIPKAAQILEQAISLVGNSPEELEKKQLLGQRLSALKNKADLKPGETFIKIPESNSLKSPHIMAYIGGQASSSMKTLNLRVGYLFSENLNSTIDLGLMNTKTTGTKFNFGLSVNGQIRLTKNYAAIPNYLIGGFGIQSFSGNKLTAHFSFGYRIMINRVTSIDIIFNLYSNGLNNTSFGETNYF